MKHNVKLQKADFEARFAHLFAKQAQRGNKESAAKTVETTRNVVEYLKAYKEPDINKWIGAIKATQSLIDEDYTEEANETLEAIKQEMLNYLYD